MSLNLLQHLFLHAYKLVNIKIYIYLDTHIYIYICLYRISYKRLRICSVCISCALYECVASELP